MDNEYYKTEQVIYGMLTESTGRHFLDSGDAYGRNWERNQKKSLQDFRNDLEVALVLEDDEENSVWGIRSLFHHLNNNLSYNEEETEKLTKFLDKHELYTNSPDSVDKFIEEYYNENDFYWEYTYSSDYANLSQDIQYAHSEKDDLIILSIHNGADARGGFTDYKVFTEADSMFRHMDVDEDDIEYELQRNCNILSTAYHGSKHLENFDRCLCSCENAEITEELDMFSDVRTTYKCNDCNKSEAVASTPVADKKYPNVKFFGNAEKQSIFKDYHKEVYCN